MKGDTECLTLYVLQIRCKNRWGMIQMAMEIMAVDIRKTLHVSDVFHGTPPAWVPSGTKTIWGETSGLMIPPTRSDIEKRDKGNHSVQKHAQRAAEKRMRIKRTEAGKRLSAAVLQREKDEKH